MTGPYDLTLLAREPWQKGAITRRRTIEKDARRERDAKERIEWHKTKAHSGHSMRGIKRSLWSRHDSAGPPVSLGTCEPDVDAAKRAFLAAMEDEGL